mgnify:CR=1 FL=1
MIGIEQELNPIMQTAVRLREHIKLIHVPDCKGHHCLCKVCITYYADTSMMYPLDDISIEPAKTSLVQSQLPDFIESLDSLSFAHNLQGTKETMSRRISRMLAPR